MVKPGTAKSAKVDKDQSFRFIETAKKTGADESGKAFEKALKKIVKSKRKAR